MPSNATLLHRKYLGRINIIILDSGERVHEEIGANCSLYRSTALQLDCIHCTVCPDLSTIYMSFGYSCPAQCYWWFSFRYANVFVWGKSVRLNKLHWFGASKCDKTYQTLCKWIQLSRELNGNERFLINENHYNWKRMNMKKRIPIEWENGTSVPVCRCVHTSFSHKSNNIDLTEELKRPFKHV